MSLLSNVTEAERHPVAAAVFCLMGLTWLIFPRLGAGFGASVSRSHLAMVRVGGFIFLAIGGGWLYHELTT